MIQRQFRIALDFGAHSGALSGALDGRPEVEWVVAADPSLAFLRRGHGPRVAADPELVPFREASFDLAISSLTLFAGTEGCTTSTWPALATIVTGAKSFCGSKPRRLKRCGLIASAELLLSTSV